METRPKVTRDAIKAVTHSCGSVKRRVVVGAAGALSLMAEYSIAAVMVMERLRLVEVVRSKDG